MWTKSTRLRFKGGFLVLATMLVSASMALMDNTWLYKASILDWPVHAPYDGTTYPIQKAPDWVHLDSAKWNYGYAELSADDLIDLPYYDPSQLQKNTDDLTWGNPIDDLIRNAKITYSVPYLGNYLLDGRENAGSHPAVDIKIPEGTPVFAIANGTIIKASTQTSGFGNHIVIIHNNFPSLNDPAANTVIYSSYSHLSENLVAEGDVVVKGQQIALSGSTGTATTPHLHFQIDNDEAPWHPFWPFTWAQVSEAGLDFFSAVNEGLGAESAKTTTVNPLKYVQTYLSDRASYTPVVENNSEPGVEGPPAESYVEEEIVEEVVEEPVVEEEPVIAEPEVIEEVVVEEVVVEEVVVEEEPEVVVEESDGFFTDVPTDHEYYEAIVFLTEEGIIEGYKDGTFRPEQTVNRVEALKFILESIEAAVEKGDLPFTDVSLKEWYAGYLYTAYKREIVDGHPDGTFKPEDTVNKAEFLKILFNGLSVDINPVVKEAPYDDVNVDDWYAPYVAYAKEIGILDPDLTEINAADGMSRGEVSDAMWRLMKLVQ